MEINMNNYENIARIKELTSLLNKYRDKYYNYSESLVSDAEYDKLFDELSSIEKIRKNIYYYTRFSGKSQYFY